MTLSGLRPLANRFIAPFVTGAKRAGLSPDAISVLAFLVACGAGASFAFVGEERQLYLLGAFFVWANGVLDLVDGALARELGTMSPSGDLFDHVFDRYSDIVIVGGLAAGIEAYALGFLAITGVLMTSYLGTQAEAVGLDRVYGGLLGRADRLVLVFSVSIIATFVTGTVHGLTIVGWMLILFAVIGHLTAIQRFHYARRDLRRFR